MKKVDIKFALQSMSNYNLTSDANTGKINMTIRKYIFHFQWLKKTTPNTKLNLLTEAI